MSIRHAGCRAVVRAALLLAMFAAGFASFTSAQGGLFVTITAPAPGATVGGTITVSADASATAVAVQFTLDGANLGAADTTVPYSVSWNTTTASNGSHTLRAVARDVLGVSWTSEPVTVTVFNDVASPTVAITGPAAGATVSGPIMVRAAASDDTGVSGVQFRLDGANFGAEDPTAPYEIPWDTRRATPGAHTLSAVVRDLAGKTTTSNPVAVTVAPQAAPTRIEQTDAAVAFEGEWIQGSTHRPWSGGTAAIGWAEGDRATLTFTGAEVSWIGLRGPQTGIARVLLDGVLVATVNAYSPVEEVHAVMFAASGLASGPHTLTIEPTYTKHPSAYDYFIIVDAFDVSAGGPPPDTTPPSVTVTSPSDGAAVKGTVAMTANASDNVGIVGVQFRLDGANLGAEDTTAPYSIAWDTLTATNGSHAVTAVARDAAGNVTTSAAVTVTVDNAAPGVSITAPAAGSSVAGTITVRADASDNAAVAGVQFRLDGAVLGAEDTTAPYAADWNTATASNGSHTLTAVARDAAGNVTTSAAVTVTVDNAAPAVSITTPAAGSTVSGTRQVVADASDNAGVAGVQFRLDGANLGAEDTAAPYTVSWDTLTASNGAHTLTAVARDAAGNTTTSAPVGVTVDNAAPSVSITAPASGSTVMATITVSADASDNTGVAGVQFRLDGVNLAAEDTTAPYAISWDTRTATNGSHTLTAVARDADGNSTTSAPVTVTVDNAAPAVAITAPAAGATVAGTVAVNADASDNRGVAGVQFRLDGVNLGAEDTAAPYTVSWDSRTASNGPHTLTAVARDAAGNVTTSAAVTVTVDNAAPSVSMTAPAAGSTVSGTTQVSADASDNAGVVGVQFFVDGVPLGAEDTSAPYATAWDTTTAANGSHSVSARARDAAGNSTTSPAVTVTVSNGGGSGATIRIEDGNTAIAYNGGWNLGNTGRPWSGGTAAIGYALGQNAILDFRGTGIRWIGFQGPWAGIANVYIDGTLMATIDGYAPAETVQATVFTATGLPLGVHTLRIEVTRTKNASSSDYVVIVDAFDIIDAPPDPNAPSVAITSPSGGATVFATIPVTASASDDTGVAAVTFFVDGTQLGSPDTSSPFGVNWNTAEVTDGPHTLTAMARDPAGNTTTSAPVTVTVANAAPPTLATSTRIENTDPGIVYVDGCGSCGQSPSWFHGSRSRDWSDGTSSFNRADGGRATFAFTGSGVKWIGFRASWAGIARVYVDGAFVTELDLYSPTEQAQVPVFQVTDLTPGSHTLAVEATGRKNPDATDYAVVIDAFDVSPGLPPPVRGTRYEESDASATFTPGWNRTDATQAWSGGTAAVASGVGERATFNFTGTSVSWIGRRAPDMGIARVYLDGALQAQVDTYYAASIQGIVYAVAGLAPGAHRLEIEVTGLKNAAATGHAIAVDAFDVRSRIEENDFGVTYSGAWSFDDTSRNWSVTSLMTGVGTAARSATAGARAEFTFAGTAVSWIGVRAPWVGMADVYIDGVFAQRVDLYSATEEVQVPVFTASGLVPGTHTLRIDVTGEKNPAAATARVVIDAFDITIPTPAPPVTRVQETDAAIAYTAGWTASGTSKLWSGTNAKLAVNVGAQATFTFTGTSVRWIGERGFSTGVARVLLDGQFIAQVDTRSPFQEEYQEPMFTLRGLAPGSHTLTIEVVGRNNEAPGTAVERIVVDAFDVQ